VVGEHAMIYLYIVCGILFAVGIVALIVYLLKKDSKPKEKVDQVEFSSLNWTCGGVNGSNAKLSKVKIRDLNVSAPRSMSFTWDVGMNEWGYPQTTPSGLACLFCKVDGRWIGGKFEWISTSRFTREFNNIKSRYAGWQPSYLSTNEFAFVVLDKDAKRRSNVVYFRK